jgi:hypothetical protein
VLALTSPSKTHNRQRAASRKQSSTYFLHIFDINADSWYNIERDMIANLSCSPQGLPALRPGIHLLHVLLLLHLLHLLLHLLHLLLHLLHLLLRLLLHLLHLLLRLLLRLLHLGGELRVCWCGVRRSSHRSCLHQRQILVVKGYYTRGRRAVVVMRKLDLARRFRAADHRCVGSGAVHGGSMRLILSLATDGGGGSGAPAGACCGGATTSMAAQLLLAGLP